MGRASLLRSDLSILLVAVIWGSSYVVMQDVGDRVPAAAFLALRFLTALPVVLLLAAPSLRRLNRVEVLAGAGFGVMLYGILILETVGVQHTSAANAGFLITVSVVFVPVLERILSRKAQPFIVYAATVVALFGCGLLLLSGGLHPRSGDLIILAAAAIRATQITLFGRHVHGQSIQNLTVVEFVVVIVLASLTSVFTGDPVWSAAGQVDGRSWLLIAYLGVLGTAFAFFMQLRSARLSSSTRVGLILCTEPVFATIFAIAVAGESLGFIQALGGVLMVGSALVGRAAEASGRAAGAPRPMALTSGREPIGPATYDPVVSGHLSDTSPLNGRRDE
ncbi:DMT family transporter [Amorphoplanes digitatis]|uniref:Drug/metabolite transporter (DMT)-like permease n=1 Tax=Actinoplanes digitatis TaxID=1868 RepID=A0A7W7HYF3_9ACTN|nr:DMT family transporter [Actinoplanes digitatis]MBB4763051.1 drug/metabolite transporter (DMT)-like permease [Actinoplanes digitatis]